MSMLTNKLLHFQGDRMMNEGEVKLSRYILIFSGYYLAFMTVVNILAHGFDIDLGSSSNLAMLLGAGYASAIKFVNDFKRAPTKKEKRLLSLGCLLASFIISIIGAVIVLSLVVGGDFTAELRELFGALPTLAWAAIFLVVGGLYYLILSVIFGWGARKYVAKSIAV